MAEQQLNRKGKHGTQTGNGSQETTNKQTWMERMQIRTSLRQHAYATRAIYHACTLPTYADTSKLIQMYAQVLAGGQELFDDELEQPGETMEVVQIFQLNDMKWKKG